MAALVAARDVADFGGPDFTLADLRDEWSHREFDLATDAVVAQDGSDAIVGYAAVATWGARLAISPDADDDAVGAGLLQWAERRQRETGDQLHRQWIGHANHRDRELLRGAGYELARSYFRMALTLDDIDRSPTVPAGVQLREVDVDHDARALYELDVASFAGSSDYQLESFDAFFDLHLAAHDFDAALSRVATDQDTIAGVILARRWTDEATGFVALLAVDPAHQGRGLGRLLMRSAFAAFAAAGLREAQLGVASDNPRALALYQGLGMQPRSQVDTYERPFNARHG